MNAVDAIRRAALLLATDPAAAADLLEATGTRLLELAAVVRAKAQVGPWQAPGGVVDRVTVAVVGPDGAERQRSEVDG